MPGDSVSSVKTCWHVNAEGTEDMTVPGRQGIEMCGQHNASQIQPRIICLEVIALTQGDVKSFLGIHIEKTKADCAAAIFVRKPAIEKWNDRLSLRANHFGRPDLIG